MKSFYVVHTVPWDDCPREAVVDALDEREVRAMVRAEFGDEDPEVTELVDDA